MTHLREIAKLLKSAQKRKGKIRYFVPSLWIEPDFRKPTQLVQIDPDDFFSRQIDTILKSPARTFDRGQARSEMGGDWSRRAVVYNLFVRLATAFDHDQNGNLDLPINAGGFRETGTFLKSIALLPYLRRLGINTIHLLPITAIGADGMKGRTGSPYAIRNPFHLDENLSEPFLNLGAEQEFQAFTEAAHHLGMRVVVEFVFRTAARDSDWVSEHPEWFYWIKESVPSRPAGSRDPNQYGPPIFPQDILRQVVSRVGSGNLNDTIPPPAEYRGIFSVPPPPRNLKKENNRWIGTLPDGARVKIPGAFADWPPDDVQPPWEDVTYLRLYDHARFNYIAYNTVRMYDRELARRENANGPLWETITDIIPHYQKNYEIDGVMIDMGHALPLPLLEQMVARAREINPDFAFWEENFNPTVESRKHGYNAAVGYFWSDIGDAKKFNALLERFSRENFPVPFFGAPESHNSPRAAQFAGGVEYSKFAWCASSFLPAIPFLHNGFELGETWPVNTGLNFTSEQIREFPAEKLPLFSAGVLNWLNPNQFCEWIRKILQIRKRHASLVTNPDPATFKLAHSPNPQTHTFERKDGKSHLRIEANRLGTDEPKISNISA